jgi:hypothetical protein
LHEKEELIHTLHDAAAESQAREREIADATQGALREKEAMIHTLHQALQDANALRNLGSVAESAESYRALVKGLEEKEAVIQELSKGGSRRYRRVHSVMRWMTQPVGYIVAATRPRLGVLYQHNPRPMHLPAAYGKYKVPASPPRISMLRRPSARQSSSSAPSKACSGRATRARVPHPGRRLRRTVRWRSSSAMRLASPAGSRARQWPVRGDQHGVRAHQRRRHGVAQFGRYPAARRARLLGDFFNRHREVDVVYGHRILLDENDQEIGRWLMPPHDAGVLSWADYVPQETLFWRRAIWEKTGGRIDESFRFAMDWDLLVRFRDAGARFCAAAAFSSAASASTRSRKTAAAIAKIGFEEMDRIRKRALGRVPSRNELRRALIPYLIRHVATDLAGG